MNTTNFLLILLGSCLILCFILMLIQNTNNTDNTYTSKNKNNSVESFTTESIQDPVINAIQSQLQLESPDDYVCSTGVSHTVKELCDYVFNKLGLSYQDYVTMDEKFLRPEELNYLKGDPTKLKQDTGWEPTYTFETMLDEMIEYWLEFYNKK